MRDQKSGKCEAKEATMVTNVVSPHLESITWLSSAVDFVCQKSIEFPYFVKRHYNRTSIRRVFITLPPMVQPPPPTPQTPPSCHQFLINPSLLDLRWIHSKASLPIALIHHVRKKQPQIYFTQEKYTNLQYKHFLSLAFLLRFVLLLGNISVHFN